MVQLVLEIFLAMSVVMVAGWAFQRAVGNAGWSDVFWTFGTGMICAIASLQTSTPAVGAAWRHGLIAAMLLIWSFRLGFYVMVRVIKGPEDIRYGYFREVSGKHFQPRMFVLLIVQAPVTALLSISILMAARRPDPHLTIQDVTGVAVMFAAIAGETLADRQMQQFKSRHSATQIVCEKGLWAFSRHPNYLFELLGWFAYPIIGISSQQRWSLLTLLAPILVYVVLRYATGVPALEAAMLRRKGKPYAEYQARVGAIFPRLFSNMRR